MEIADSIMDNTTPSSELTSSDVIFLVRQRAYDAHTCNCNWQLQNDDEASSSDDDLVPRVNFATIAAKKRSVINKDY